MSKVFGHITPLSHLVVYGAGLCDPETQQLRVGAGTVDANALAARMVALGDERTLRLVIMDCSPAHRSVDQLHAAGVSGTSHHRPPPVHRSKRPINTQ